MALPRSLFLNVFGENLSEPSIFLGSPFQFFEPPSCFNFVHPLGHYGPGKEYPYVNSKQALEGVELVSHNNEHMNIKQKTIERLKRIPPGGNFNDIPKDSPYYVKGMISHVYRRLDPNQPSKQLSLGVAAVLGDIITRNLELSPIENAQESSLFLMILYLKVLLLR